MGRYNNVNEEQSTGTGADYQKKQHKKESNWTLFWNPYIRDFIELFKLALYKMFLMLIYKSDFKIPSLFCVI